MNGYSVTASSDDNICDNTKVRFFIELVQYGGEDQLKSTIVNNLDIIAGVLPSQIDIEIKDSPPDKKCIVTIVQDEEKEGPTPIKAITELFGAKFSNFTAALEAISVTYREIEICESGNEKVATKTPAAPVEGYEDNNDEDDTTTTDGQNEPPHSSSPSSGYKVYASVSMALFYVLLVSMYFS